jgi:hypothetical protein
METQQPRAKSGKPDSDEKLGYFLRPAVVAKYEPLRSALRTDASLGNEDFSNAQLSITTCEVARQHFTERMSTPLDRSERDRQVLQMMEDVCGMAAKPRSKMTKLPTSLFQQDYSTRGPLFFILLKYLNVKRDLLKGESGDWRDGRLNSGNAKHREVPCSRPAMPSTHPCNSSCGPGLSWRR